MRPLLAGLVGLIACVVLPLAVVSQWVSTVASDTERYVETVGPLSDDEDVQEAVADRMADEVGRRLGTDAGRSAVRAAALGVVRGPAFDPVWRAGNREAHRAAVAVLESERTDADGRVVVDLTGLVSALTGELVRAGLPAAVVPQVNPAFTVARDQDLERARTAYRVTEAAGRWLPVAWLLLAAGVLLVARRRRRAAALLAVGSALALGLLALALVGSGGIVAAQVPPGDEELARAIWDVVVDSLRHRVHVLLGAATLIGVVLGALSALPGRRTPA